MHQDLYDKPILLGYAIYEQTPEELKKAAKIHAKLTFFALLRMHKFKILGCTILPLLLITLTKLTSHYYPNMFNKDIVIMWYVLTTIATCIFVGTLLLPLCVMPFMPALDVSSYKLNRIPSKPFEIFFYADVIIAKTPQYDTPIQWNTTEIKHLGQYLTVSLDSRADENLVPLNKFLTELYIPIDALSNSDFILNYAMSYCLTSDYSRMNMQVS